MAALLDFIRVRLWPGHDGCRFAGGQHMRAAAAGTAGLGRPAALALRRHPQGSGPAACRWALVAPS